jgi:ABC-type sugar transport system ATPase subunit
MVLRDGNVAGNVNASEVSREEIVRMMVWAWRRRHARRSMRHVRGDDNYDSEVSSAGTAAAAVAFRVAPRPAGARSKM